MYRTAAIASVLIVLASAPLAADRFAIDSDHSRITFTVPYDFMVLGVLEGEFREFAGEVDYDRVAPTRSSVRVSIVTSSVDTRFRARDIGLKSDEYLAVETYPTAELRSTEVVVHADGLIVRGDLTMRGRTHPVEIVCDLLDLGETLVVQGRTVLSREAFDVAGPQLSGEVMIADEVALNLQMVLRRVSAEG